MGMHMFTRSEDALRWIVRGVFVSRNPFTFDPYLMLLHELDDFAKDEVDFWSAGTAFLQGAYDSLVIGSDSNSYSSETCGDESSDGQFNGYHLCPTNIVFWVAVPSVFEFPSQPSSV